MTFDRELLALYRQLLQTTRLADAYAEFVRMFRFLRVRLEQEMPAYTFQGGIVENAMDYSYFQCASPALKGLGLKLAVVFVHRPFRLEVWLSGRNRACQQQWHKRLQAGGTPFELAQDPARQDYILRAPLPNVDLADANRLVQVLRQTLEAMTGTIQ